MKTRGISALFVLGLLFFVQSAVIASLSLGKAPTDPLELYAYITMRQIWQLVTSLDRSLFGCLACWLLALYLRTKRLEREINEARTSAGSSR